MLQAIDTARQVVAMIVVRRREFIEGYVETEAIGDEQ
jgi:hypothetical protein